jgi:integrase
MWDRARERAGITEDVQFKDLRALGATDAARRGDDRRDIQKRLVHTSGKTTDIYIKEAIPDVSEIDMKLPW